jgi:hypothetical protein
LSDLTADSFLVSLHFSSLNAPVGLLVDMRSPSDCHCFYFRRRFSFCNELLNFSFRVPMPHTPFDYFHFRVSTIGVPYAGLVRESGETTSYLNSILQCVFHLPLLRRMIFSITSAEHISARNLQLLFARMQSHGKTCDTTYLTNSFKCFSPDPDFSN